LDLQLGALFLDIPFQMIIFISNAPLNPLCENQKNFHNRTNRKRGKQGKKGNQAKLCQPNQKLEIQNKKLSRSVEQLNTISHPNIPGPKVARVGTQKAQETSTKLVRVCCSN
jgi:hypothetical protein